VFVIIDLLHGKGIVLTSSIKRSNELSYIVQALFSDLQLLI
jgi:hypothetical protein